MTTTQPIALPQATERAEHDLTAAFVIVELSRPLDMDVGGAPAKGVTRTWASPKPWISV